MSELSRDLFMTFIDYSAISRRRIENFQVLAEYFPDIALYPELPSDVVPMAFPIRLRNRDFIRQCLFEKNIFPPIHWALRDIVPNTFQASHRLASDMMTLPCDQRYGRD